jgi:hypothetical protein
VPVRGDLPKDVPMRTMRTNEIEGAGEKKARRGRAKKTGRPGM